jgi:hypothetical protein
MAAFVTQLNVHIIDSAEALRQTLGDGVALSTSLTPGLSPIHVNARQLHAAIVDIAAHARDAMPGGGRFVIETRNVVLEEHHSDVRRAQYVQLSLTYASDAPLPDLSSAYALLEQCGGHITTSIEVGHGLSINLYFPDVRASEPD